MTMPGVSRETTERLSALERLIRDEAVVQNLVSAASLDDFWRRHIEDSLQLLPLAPPAGRWLDIGSGAGLPGMVLALASADHRFVLAEPRALRAAFLERVAAFFSLEDRVEVVRSRIESMPAHAFDIISARAVARIDVVFGMATHLGDERTTWVLPKGRSVREELAAARQTWQGDFRLVPSLTDPEAAILVARGVKRRTKR